MPHVLVETRGGWLGAKRTALLDAMRAATVEALRIPARHWCCDWSNIRRSASLSRTFVGTSVERQRAVEKLCAALGLHLLLVL